MLCYSRKVVDPYSYLKEAGIKWEKRKELLDKVSAQIILQNYLDENQKGVKNG